MSLSRDEQIKILSQASHAATVKTQGSSSSLQCAEAMHEHLDALNCAVTRVGLDLQADKSGLELLVDAVAPLFTAYEGRIQVGLQGGGSIVLTWTVQKALSEQDEAFLRDLTRTAMDYLRSTTKVDSDG